MITAPLGFSARMRSMFARSARGSICRRSIQTWFVSVIAIRMFPFSFRVAVDAPGRLISMPASFTNEAVTMKKINMMKTTSSMGVKLTSLSGLLRPLFRLMGFSQSEYKSSS